MKRWPILAYYETMDGPILLQSLHLGKTKTKRKMNFNLPQKLIILTIKIKYRNIELNSYHRTLLLPHILSNFMTRK